MADIPEEIEAEATTVVESYDAGDPKQVNQARKRAGRRKKEELDFVEAMMKLPQGRKWLWELMEDCCIFGDPIVPRDLLSTGANIGKQDIGKKILANATKFPELYMKMCAESRRK